MKVAFGLVLFPALVALLLFTPYPSTAFYLPGIAPVDYETGAPLEVFANRLVSPVNKVPYNFFSLPFCAPSKESRPKSKHRNLGQIISGEMVTPTQFKINMASPETCRLLCQEGTVLDDKEKKKLVSRIHDKYAVRLNVDNMPLVMEHKAERGDTMYSLGYRIGAEMDGKFYLFNHLAFTILYHIPPHSEQDGAPKLHRVVGFHVVPASIKHNPANPCDLSSKELQEVVTGDKIFVTYSTSFEESPIRWATRWDPLLKASDEQRGVLWFSIVNSVFMGLFLSAMVAFIMMRTIYQDFVRYNRLEEEEDMQDETGWKLVHGDVFRPPAQSALLSIFCGSGAQLLIVTFTVLVFAALGFLSPANRGGLLSAMMYCWVFSSVFCGYVAARIYTSLSGTNNKLVTLGSAFVFPGIMFSMMLFLNLFMTVKRSTAAIPFFTLLFLIFLWFGMSVPLNVFGGYLGFRQKPVEYPVRTNHIPREVPPPPFNIPYAAYAILSGLLPFGVIFMELAFILNSFWKNQLYYMFGLLFVVLLLLIVTCAEVSIVFTYMTLLNENYHWWWNSFFCCASSALYMFGYAILFYVQSVGVKELPNHLISTLTYVGYMSVISLGFGLMTGYIGFSSSFIFVRRIFASVRVD
eukprot:CAMPEP_0184692032 /NCGR_PEP_ID=MMETSP0313-20130426/676_1 /TAXON_ID=2792 /ORGANISM="Porphyridium aerugineum, Strain SAG 1380-2" /LENGTH=633 /DNA_ID=CAMNT_0027149827 /DNA_START=347 /DNA_END=2248 /DNA_ORIENTATION=-